MTTDVLDGVLDEAGAQLEDAVELRRRIHEQPELGLELPGTQAMVLEALDGLPLTVTTGTTSSSVVAVLDGDEPGPTVLLRGDMDALPMHEDTGLEFASRDDGAMHACGHDTHVAMLAGAAKLLAARRGALRGPGGVHVPARRGGPPRRPVHARGRAARHGRRRRRAGVDGLRHPPDPHDPVGDDRQPGPARCWPRPTSSRSPCGAGAATPRCPTTPATPSRSPARSSPPCRPWSPAGSTPSTRRWSRSPRSAPAPPPT